MTTVRGYIEGLQDLYGESLDARANDWMARADNAAARMSELVNSLLAFARDGGADSAEREPVSIPDLVAEVCEDLDQLLSSTDAQVGVGPPPPGAAEVLAYRSRLRQVLQNLIQNTVKYRHPDRTPHAVVSVEERGSHWQVTVTDNAVGVPAAQREQVFSMFARLDEREPGHGIGLAACRQVVERHGGADLGGGQPGGPRAAGSASPCFADVRLSPTRRRLGCHGQAGALGATRRELGAGVVRRRPPGRLEFGAAAAVARWTGQGKQVGYTMVTSGEAGIDGLDPEECRAVREAEQVESARVVGVETVDFLRQPDGILEYGVPLRRLIAAEVRRHRPEIVITGNFRDTFGGRNLNQADHIAVGKAVLDAVRDAGNRWIFPEQLTAAGGDLEPWGGVRAVWAFGSPQLHARRGHDRDLRRRGGVARGAPGLHRRSRLGELGPARVPRGLRPRHRPAVRRAPSRRPSRSSRWAGATRSVSAWVAVEHAELVALRVGEHGEALLAGLPHIGRARPQRDEPVDLGPDVAVLGPQVEVQPDLLPLVLVDRLEPDRLAVTGTTGRIELGAPVVAVGDRHAEGFGPERPPGRARRGRRA